MPYASWSGVCRTDGGGFCGMRTLPFVEPLQVVDAMKEQQEGEGEEVTTTVGEAAKGLYVKCRLTSDNEPHRRVWKMTLRTDTSRGELVYQSQFQLPESSSPPLLLDPSSTQEQEWHTIQIPFDNFLQVRGPRVVPNGLELDLTKGLYQIGMTMSKFQLGLNTTEITNFRPGYFELQIQQIGLYYENDNGDKKEVVQKIEDESKEIQTLTKGEMMKKRPLILKVLLTFSKILFSEKANRRKSAMNILRNKRNMTRTQAIMFGLRSRSKSVGLFRSVVKTMSIIAIDVFRTVSKKALTIGLVYPLRLVRGLVGFVKPKKK